MAVSVALTARLRVLWIEQGTKILLLSKKGTDHVPRSPLSLNRRGVRMIKMDFLGAEIELRL